MMIEIMST